MENVLKGIKGINLLSQKPMVTLPGGGKMVMDGMQHYLEIEFDDGTSQHLPMTAAQKAEFLGKWMKQKGVTIRNEIKETELIDTQVAIVMDQENVKEVPVEEGLAYLDEKS